MKIDATEAALLYFSELLQHKGAAAIRLGVKRGSGCAGASYILDLADEKNSVEIEQVIKEIRFFLNPKDSDYIDGVLIDYVGDEFSKTIRFINPNAKNECGCQESFGI